MTKISVINFGSRVTDPDKFQRVVIALISTVGLFLTSLS